jgi:hypothetical protein
MLEIEQSHLDIRKVECSDVCLSSSRFSAIVKMSVERVEIQCLHWLILKHIWELHQPGGDINSIERRGPHTVHGNLTGCSVRYLGFFCRCVNLSAKIWSCT